MRKIVSTIVVGAGSKSARPLPAGLAAWPLPPPPPPPPPPPLLLLLLLRRRRRRRRHGHRRRRSLTSALATARADRVSSSAARTRCTPGLPVPVRARDAWRTTGWRSCRVEIGVVRTCCSLQESGRSFRRCMRASSCATTCRLCASLVSRSTTLCRAARLRAMSLAPHGNSGDIARTRCGADFL